MVSKGSEVKSEMGVGGTEVQRWGAEMIVSMAVKAVPCRSWRSDLEGKAPEMRTLAKLLVTP